MSDVKFLFTIVSFNKFYIIFKRFHILCSCIYYNLKQLRKAVKNVLVIIVSGIEQDSTKKSEI